MRGPDGTGGHYNPKVQDTCTPDAAQDSCEVGDLSGKFGLLGTSSTSDIATYTDTVASILYDSAAGSRGSMWIVGRSIVIHDADGSRWSCANIGEAGVGVDVALATGVTGSIELFQPASGYASFEYARSTGSAYATSMTVSLSGYEAAGNKWHVHDFPVPSGGDCGGTGGHYDPMQSVPEYGDLSAKHGLLTAAGATFYELDDTPFCTLRSTTRHSTV